MGKNGDLMRANKKKSAMFTISREWLEAHDREVIANYKKIVYEEAQKWLDGERKRVESEIDAEVKKEWDQRAKDFAGAGTEDRFLSTLGYMLSVTCKVLIRDFKWTPLPKNKNADPRMRLVRLCTAIAKEVEDICNHDDKDIRHYCDEVYEEYGVKFEWGEVENPES